MRIEVVGESELANFQARAYAEYRLFAALARYARRVRSARIELQPLERPGAPDGIRCAMTVVLEPSGHVRARTRDRHAYGAINRAAERIGTLMGRTDPTSPSS